MSKLIALIGPSGSGKSAIIDMVVERYGYKKVKTTTTRKPRPGESPNAYYFVDPIAFTAMDENECFVETATYAGERYGTTKKAIYDILDNEENAIVAVDINGARAYKQAFLDETIVVFVYRDKQEVIEAIIARDIPTAEKAQRIQQLDEEYELIKYCDGCVINNGTIEQAARVVKTLAASKN